MPHLKENETEYDYNLGQGRTAKKLDANVNIVACVISLILVICLLIIAYNAFKPLFT